FLEIQRMSSRLKLLLQLVERKLDTRLLVEEHAVEAVAGDLAKRIFNDLLPKAWIVFLFASVLVDYARRPDRHCESLPPMFKIAGERSKKGIDDAQRSHMLARIVFRLVYTGFDHIPDYRLADVDIALPDILMSAFAMFSLKAPSLLAFDKERAEGNLHTIYGIQRVPCDTYMREILDPVSPKWLRPVFKSVFRQLQRGKALEEMVFLDGHYLLALDGT